MSGLQRCNLNTERNLLYICSRKGDEKMYWIIIIAVFAIITAREMRRERRNPGSRSSTDDATVKTFRGPNDKFS